jgi:hypothetical protein
MVSSQNCSLPGCDCTSRPYDLLRRRKRLRVGSRDHKFMSPINSEGLNRQFVPPSSMASYPSYTLGQWKTMTGDAPSRVDLSNILNASYTSSHTPDLYPPAASNPPQHRPATSKDTSCSNLPSPATSLEDIYKKPASSTRRRHRRRQLENEAHVNRPPNCFILFRIHWVQHQKNADKKRLSARAGEAWKELSDKERARWRALAKDVAADHLQHHPDYVYKPRKRGSSASKQDIHKEGQPRAKFLDSDVWSGTSSLVNTAHSPSAAPSDLVFEAGPVSTTTLVGTSASTVPIARASSLPALVNPLPREAPRAVQRSHSMRSPHMHNCVVPQAYSPWSLSPDFSLHQEVVETASYPTVHNNVSDLFAQSSSTLTSITELPIYGHIPAPGRCFVSHSRCGSVFIRRGTYDHPPKHQLSRVPQPRKCCPIPSHGAHSGGCIFRLCIHRAHRMGCKNVWTATIDLADLPVHAWSL